MAHDIFISYSREDLPLIEPLVKDIEQKSGLKCWIDWNGIESGSQFEEVIVKAIDSVDVVLFFISENSINSPYAKMEVNYAYNMRKKVVPIVLDGGNLRGWFLFKFGAVDYIDIAQPRQYEKLIQNLKMWCADENSQSNSAQQSKPAPVQPSRKSPLTTRTKKLTAIVLSAICVVAAVVGLTISITSRNSKGNITNTLVNNKIVYKSFNKKIITPYNIEAFDANIVSNTYEGEEGIIVFDKDITTIGKDAFYDCADLITVTLPNGVTSIGDYAFCGCECLGKVTIPDNVSLIGEHAFFRCKLLSRVSIPAGVTSIGDYAFAYCECLLDIAIPESVSSIGESAFCSCTSLRRVTIPESVSSMGRSVFIRCDNLEGFYGKYASSDNSCLVVNGTLNSFAPAGLTHYTIPNNITSIGRYTFFTFENLTFVTIPNGVTAIEEMAFNSCKGLTSITIPESVTSIEKWAFRSCEKLTKIYCKAKTPPVGNSDMFSDNAPNRVIYVPRNSVKEYKMARFWSDYASSIVGYDF